MRLITARCAPVTARYTGHLCLHCLLIFQQLGEISKTCNQLHVWTLQEVLRYRVPPWPQPQTV
jgi:hypothetical protein